MGPFLKPEDTRHLVLVDTPNRIIASVINAKLQTAVEKVIGDCQRGFLRGRSILTNIVELEGLIQEAACNGPSRRHGCSTCGLPSPP